ncbi:MAG: VCBS repeat-containing protein [Pyrinomonadaceae bacterium]|nr:VCBS repeat-containing protein [Pyrinomonadaceae bacterium]
MRTVRIRQCQVIFIALTLIAASFHATADAQVAASAFVNFEASQTNPVRLSPTGTRMFAVNTPDARLSVFDLSQPSNPRLMKEIPVGIEPVSVNPRTDDEAWVVNQVSDSISVVSVSRGIVTDTIYVKDEPSDVVFAGSKAFVSVSRKNEIRVFDVNTHAQIGAPIAVFGGNPRALAVSPDGAKVYAAFALSGNRTTLIPFTNAPAPPSPTNTLLPPAPQQSIIVDATDPAWNPSFIKFTMPDNDVVEINTATMAVARYFSRVGTINLGIAVRPTNGDLYVANTDARNLVRFEPSLRGHSVDNRITRIEVASGTVTPFDLNPDINYSILPNTAALSTALAQPTAVVFDPGGNFMYVAAFGTDRIARVGLDGSILSRIEVGNAPGPRHKRGPRGLALKPNAQRLYVLNRLSNTISIVNTVSETVLSEIPVGSFDPTPTVIRNGRGFLYDAKLSGNGTSSCAACHIDSDMDHLAWDLGDRGGQMQTVLGNNGLSFQMHPMKGPMVTQSLRGVNELDPLHWRGDRGDFLAFNPTFDTLLGGAQLSSEDMAAFRDFIKSLRFQPNPNQNLDRSSPETFAGGSPSAGRYSFIFENYAPALSCNSCHEMMPGPGSNRLIIPANLLQEPQAFKVPHLRNVYQKLGFNNTPGASTIGGFGLVHDGSDSTLFGFLSRPVFGTFANDTTRKTNLSAFLQCFDTGFAPAVGYSQTLTAANVNESSAGGWVLLEQQTLFNVDLIAKGTIDGRMTGLFYRRSSDDYQTDRTGVGPFTRPQLRNKILAGDTLTVMGVPPGSGIRMGIDRNLDGVLDGDAAARSNRSVDFDGDGKTDISVFRPSDGAWYILQSASEFLMSQPWGLSSDKLAPADYDGDGRTDIAVFRNATGIWYILNSSTSTFTFTQFGMSGDLPVPGDFDGDGKADLAVFRPSSGIWYILNSSDATLRVQQFGRSGDHPARGDFDGDGKNDLAVFRPGDGTWYILQSFNNVFRAQQFGTSGDRPVPGDYDGDGKTDLAVFRPSNVTWYIQQSFNNTFRAQVFGFASDQPSPGDYDGDGKTDLAVFRPSDSSWYIWQSSNSSLRARQWGASGDFSVPSAYIP